MRGGTLLRVKVGYQRPVRRIVLVLWSTVSLFAQSFQTRSGPYEDLALLQGPTSDSFENLAARAQAAMDADRVPEAIRLYAQATNLRPKWTEGWWHLGTLCFDSGKFEPARDAFAHFVALEQEQPGPGFSMLGLSEFQLKHYSRALAILEKGIRLGLGSNAPFTRS